MVVTTIARCAVALAQLLESISRLMLATSRMTEPEDIERQTCAVSNLAYDAEHRATYQHED